MYGSWANIDWQATAAVVQAVGSVVAIGAAIYIDQGTTRRQRFEAEAAAILAGRSAPFGFVNQGNSSVGYKPR